MSYALRQFEGEDSKYVRYRIRGLRIHFGPRNFRRGSENGNDPRGQFNLSTDLGGATPTTPAAALTSSLAQLLKGASHVDAATGTREINQGIGDTLAKQVGQLPAQSGFSQPDAAKASASLVQQFATASPGSNVLAFSLSSQSQSAGGYTASVGGGKEVSAYSVQSTATLNVAFDLGSGDLSVKLDQHKVAATRVEWSAAKATNMSIALSQPELEAIGFTPIGTSSNSTGSPVQESVTTQFGPQGRTHWRGI